MHRDAANGRLEQGKLIWNERIAANEVVFVSEVRELLAAVSKLEEGLEVVELLAVGGFQQFGANFVFRQQSLLDHFGYVSAGELEAVGEAGLDLRKVVTLLLAHVSKHGVHVFLCGDNDPGTPLAFGGQTFGDRLQVGHQLGVFGDVLADLIDKEIEPEIGGLFVQPCLHLIAKVLDGNTVLGSVLVENSFRQCWVFARDFGISAGDVARLQQCLFAPTLPWFACMALVGLLKGFELLPAIEIPFELCDVPLLAEVAAHLVEDFDEH